MRIAFFVLAPWQAKVAAMTKLQGAVALFHRSRAQTNLPLNGSGSLLRNRELLVLAAETALSNGNFDLARDQVCWMLSIPIYLVRFSRHRCEQVRCLLSESPPRDQFLARALFVDAACLSHEAEKRGLNGSLAVQQRLRAVAPILDAVAIAKVSSLDGHYTAHTPLSLQAH